MNQQASQNTPQSPDSLVEQIRKAWPVREAQAAPPSEETEVDDQSPPSVEGIEVQVLR